MKKTNITTLILLLFGILLLNLSFVNAEASWCAEKSIEGAWCQNVLQSECDTSMNPLKGMSYRCDRTSCESTTYCSIGTCANTATGECISSPEANCNPAEGGFFYDKPKDEVSSCQIGCCLLGDGATLVERIRCDVLGKDFKIWWQDLQG